MNVRSFLSSFKASYRFLISTCFVAHLDSVSAENMIHDLLISAISSYKVSFMHSVLLTTKIMQSYRNFLNFDVAFTQLVTGHV